MRIVHIITRLILGGAQENTLLSCLGQHQMGHEVSLLTGPAVGPEGSLMDRACRGGYPIITIDAMRRAILPLQDALTYRELVSQLRRIKPDIVHTHSSKAGIIGRWAAHQAGVTGIVHTIHGLSFTSSTLAPVNTVYKVMERRTAPITSAIVCVAEAMARQSLQERIGRAEQYHTVYSGMETAPFLQSGLLRQSSRQQLAIAEDDIVVGTIARLFYLKGYEDFLTFAPRLCNKYPRLKFLWVGDGILKPWLVEQIQRLNLTDRFILTGLVEPARIPALTAAMDILAHPSRREGLARAIVQGALAGKPVVTYDIDGNREALIPNISGRLIAPFDVRGFESALDELCGDTALRDNMGRAGQIHTAERFDWQTMVRQLQIVYEKVLSL